LPYPTGFFSPFSLHSWPAASTGSACIGTQLSQAGFDTVLRMKYLFRLIAAFVACALIASSALAADAWTELAKPGAIVLFRHATAPGVGDPPGFKPDDCATQRNLDERGRAEARKLGEQFRARNIQVGAVLSSQWCRTRDTARLAFGSQVRDEPAFNSFFRLSPQARDAQTAQARAVLARWRGPGALVVVTHQVNIQALTGVGAASAEGVVVRSAADGSLQVVARIEP
jgi:phosphohistidine phosphatase SixA